MFLGDDGWYCRVAYNPYCPGIMELVAPKAAGRAFCRRRLNAHVCSWHLADVPLALTNVCFEGKNGHDAA
jgi:hypothetical protein